MKQQVSPVVAAIAVVVVVGVAALAYFKFGSVSHSEKAPPGMPDSVQKQWQEIAGGAAPGKGGTSGASGTGTIPGVGQMSGSQRGPGAPMMGLPTGPPPGR